MTGSSISQYRVLEKLGEGGMGAVYKARDTRLNRLVAIKVLPPNKSSDRDLKHRLIREARAASSLNHPNIITIYEIGSTELEGETTDFIAMEYVDGKTLDELIRAGKGLPIDKVLKYAIQVADALTAAHGAGIIHRDLKPNNIMVTEAGRVKILDFGLARLVLYPLSAGGDETMLAMGPRTEEGMLVGTAAYMSPEHVEGKIADARSDIFSLGCTLYEMITGERPFERPSLTSTVVAVLRDDPKPASGFVRNVPPQLNSLVSRCLRKDPARRIQHIDDLKLELEDIQAELNLGSSSSSRRPPVIVTLKRNWVLLALAGTGILAIGIGLYTAMRTTPPPPVKIVTVMTNPGIERTPTLSPDGKQVAFSWNGEKQDNFDIYVKLVSGGQHLRLTTDAEPDMAPAWSPDGTRIAFFRRSSILQISPLGGPERKLADLNGALFGVQLAWTPDGNNLVAPIGTNEGEPWSLWSIPAGTGERRQLTIPPKGAVGDGDPAVSPNGRLLGFARWFNTSAAEIFVARLEGGEPRRLTTDNARIQGLTWSPDGKDIIFSSNRGGNFALWRVRADGTRTVEPRRVPEAGPGAVAPMIAQGSADSLAYVRMSVDFNVGRIDLPASRGGKLSGLSIIASTRTDDSPRFSPDGRQIAFVSDRTGRSEIWVAKSDGADPVQLTFLNSSTGSPHWSPDGKTLVFDSLVGANKDLFTVPVEGGLPHRITTDKWQEWRPSYSRDGRWIYFGCDRTSSPQIWKMPAQGGDAVQVTQQGGYEALESIDGKTLYYSKSRFRPGVWKRPIEGETEELILPDVRTGSWDVAKNGIYFLGQRRTVTDWLPLELFSFQTHRTADVVQAAMAAMSGTPALSVTPDGRSVLYVRADQSESELMLLQNFR